MMQSKNILKIAVLLAMILQLGCGDDGRGRGQNSNTNDADVISFDTNESDQDTNESDQDTNESDQDTNESDQDANEPDQDTNDSGQDTNEPDQDTNEPDQDTNEPEKDTNEPEKDTNDACNDCTVPLPTCDNDVVVTYEASCVNNACKVGQKQRVNCAATGKICEQGQCVTPIIDLCANVTCTPVAPYCNGDTLNTTNGPYTCDPDTGKCEGFQLVTSSCSAQGKQCKDGACVAKPRKRVFVSVARYNGDLRTAGGATTGPKGADNLCQTEANGASIGGTWKAWISGAGDDAVDRIKDVGPWYLVDNTTLVATNRAQLVTAGPQTKIDMMPDGTRVPVLFPDIDYGRFAMTGTAATGRWLGNSQSCTNWTTTQLNNNSRGGSIDKTDHNWTNTSEITFWCNQHHRLYCFEQ